MDDIFLFLINMTRATLLNAMPVDTRNMYTNTTLQIKSDKRAIITISGPTIYGEDYASFVNYNDRHTAKLEKNYQYIERSCINAAEIVASMFGGSVSFDGSGDD